MRAPLRDKAYRRYPIGQEVGHFLRTLRVARRSANTLESYETVLRLLTLEHLDLQSLEQFSGPSGVDLLYAFLDKYWGDSADATMEQRCRVLASFFGWAYSTERISRDPAKHLVPPRRRPTTETRARARGDPTHRFPPGASGRGGAAPARQTGAAQERSP
jgi:site-specific recombinase XerC